MVYQNMRLNKWERQMRYRTRIVMVYLSISSFRIICYFSYRTRIVMVYHGLDLKRVSIIQRYRTRIVMVYRLQHTWFS